MLVLVSEKICFNFELNQIKECKFKVGFWEKIASLIVPIFGKQNLHLPV